LANLSQDQEGPTDREAVDDSQLRKLETSGTIMLGSSMAVEFIAKETPADAAK